MFFRVKSQFCMFPDNKAARDDYSSLLNIRLALTHSKNERTFSFSLTHSSWHFTKQNNTTKRQS